MKLAGKKIAILATDGFEISELFSPLDALREAGATVDIISDKSGSIKSWDKTDWGKSIDVTKTLSEANASDYNALMLPGGVINPDKLRVNKDALKFVKEFSEAKKPIGAICHAPQILISAGLVSGRKMTSYKSIKTDMENAGALWEDSEVVVDKGLVTSRNPDDLPAFNKKLIEEVGEGKH